MLPVTLIRQEITYYEAEPVADTAEDARAKAEQNALARMQTDMSEGAEVPWRSDVETLDGGCA